MSRTRSKAEKSVIVAGAGFLAGFAIDFMKEIKAQGGGDEDFHRLTTDAGRATLKEMAALAVRHRQTSPDVYSVTVDYSKSIADMVALGRYDWKNSDVNDKNFRAVGSGIVAYDLTLVHLNRNATDEEVITEIARRGLEPAGLSHLLAFGEKYPDIQRQFPIVEMRDSCRNFGSRAVAYLYEYVGERDLNLYDLGGRWHSRCRFLAVRKR